MAAITTLVGARELRARLRAVAEAPRNVLRDIQADAVLFAKVAAPRKTSRLGRSIQPGALTDTFAIVEATADYAAYVELGTRAHVIRPRNKKALRFPARGVPTTLAGRVRTPAARRLGRGAYAFARKVNHPGTKPQPYLVPAARAAVEDNIGADVIVHDWNGAA